jgi:CelD/BcsL family acetyltransferase involved in cellulose biosynthesis
VRLDQIDADSRWPPLLVFRWPGPLRPRLVVEATISAPTVTIDGRDFEGWMASLRQKVRANKRRSRRLLAEAGATIRMAGPDDVDARLDALLRLHAERFGERSDLTRPEAAAMLHEAARALIGAARFRVWYAELDGRVIGAHLSVAAGGHLASWNGGWDSEFAGLAPLKLVKLAAWEDAMARGERRVDLGEDATSAKTRVADRDDPVARIAILPRDVRRPLALALSVPERLRLTARGALRRLPEPARRRLRRLRGGFGRLRRFVVGRDISWKASRKPLTLDGRRHTTAGR